MKNRAERRRLRAEHDRKPRGRPPGRAPFRKNPNRFEITFATVLMRIFRISKYEAARLTTIWLHSKLATSLESVPGGFVKFSGQYGIDAGPNDKRLGLHNRAEYLVRQINDADAQFFSWSEADRIWARESVFAIQGLLELAIIGAFETEYVLRLQQLGWNNTVIHIFRRLFESEKLPQSNVA